MTGSDGHLVCGFGELRKFGLAELGGDHKHGGDGVIDRGRHVFLELIDALS